MKIFKFGGASVKDAAAVKNLAEIVKTEKEPLVVVISAMGKTTNTLEVICSEFFDRSAQLKTTFKQIAGYHLDILEALGLGRTDDELFTSLLNSLLIKLEEQPSLNYNLEYDQIVSYGELLSTAIVAAYLKAIKLNVEWVDVRKVLKTDDSYRDAKINFEISSSLVKETFNNSKIYITQGFIGCTSTGKTTTLGREGSDYSAALLAYFLDTKSVTVWKDVDGVLNADPKWFDDTIKLDQITYEDAIELAFYGASVIHPKTIQPLKEKGIPLYVRSFIYKNMQGTHIGNVNYKKLIPCFIFKVDQILLNFHSRDLSFITEDGMQKVLSVFARYKLRINLMQNTAVNFRVCLQNDATRIIQLIEDLSLEFKVTQEAGLELITIRYYDEFTIERVLINKEVLLEQHSKNTVQMVVRPLQTIQRPN